MSGDCVKIGDCEEGIPSKLFCIPKQYENDVDSVLITYGTIQDRIEKLAYDIYKAANNEPLTLLCVLKGGYRFFHDLAEKMQQISRFSATSIPLSMEFIRLKSYEDDSNNGKVKIFGVETLQSLENKNILIVEDIIETGLTMKKLLTSLKDYNPRSVKVASLLVKRTERSSGYYPDFVGFEVPNFWLVGYALDFNDRFRDLNHICVLNDEGKQKYSLKHSQSQLS